jgi:hypothetical protein
MFGIAVPGCFPIFTFQQVDATRWYVDLPNPGTVSNLTFFLTQPIPDDYAAALSYSLPPFAEVEFIGAVANQRPSDILHTSWSFNPSVNSQPFLRLLVSFEPITTIASLVEMKSSTDIRQTYARKLALNLFRFMESYNQNTGQYGELLVLPCDVLDKWLSKFETKFKYDPNFVLSTE